MAPVMDAPPLIHCGYNATTIAWHASVRYGATNGAFLAPVVAPTPPSLASFFTGIPQPALSLLALTAPIIDDDETLPIKPFDI